MSKTKIIKRTSLPCLFTFLLILVCSGDSTAQTTSPKQLSLSFNEEIAIGGNTSEDTGYFLTSPYQIRTDSEQNIYIAEGKQKTMMVFSPEGKYLHSIGRSGNGPGEFPTGPRFILNNDNDIVALDLESKRITWFSKEGNILQEYAPSEAGMVWSRKFRQTADGNYIVLKKPRDIGDDTPDNYRTNVLHFYNESFERRIASFGNFDNLLPEADSKFVKMISNSFNSGNLCLVDEGEFWYAPGFYNGHIYHFKKKNGGWVRVDTYEGQMAPAHAVEVGTEPEEGGMSITNYSSGLQRSSGKINSYSLGLFKMSDGRVLHFSGQRMQDSLHTVVEVFNPNGRLVGTGMFDEIKISDSMLFRRGNNPSLWLDDNNRFYFVDERDIPVVRVGRIEGL